MTETPAPNALFAALAAVQAELPHIAKTETGKIEGTSKTGKPYSYEYDYADLTAVSDTILPLLGKHGLSFMVRPTMNGDRFVLAYSLLHSSGEREDGEYPLPERGTPQELGKHITYGRRYVLCAVTGVAPGGEDNDADGAGEVVTDRPRVRTAYSDPAHVRLTQQSPDELANGRGPADRKRGQLPEDEWTTPPEDQPGSITPPQVRSLQAHLAKFFDKTERDQRLNAAAAIIGRPIKTSSDLSYVEADQLIKELEGLMLTAEHAEPKQEPREALIALLALMGADA